MRNFMQTSNPALTNEKAFNPFAYREGVTRDEVRETTLTLNDVVNKTAILVLIAVIGGAVGYGLLNGPLGAALPGIGMLAVVLGGVIVTFGVAMVIYMNPRRAKGLAPVYAVIEGVVLGVITASLDQILQAQGVVAVGGLALQAFVITISIMLAMLALYYTGLVRFNRRAIAVLSTLTLGIMFMYLINFVLLFFGMRLPFLAIGSALEGGTSAWIGLGVNALFLVIASLWLVVDFQMIESKVKSGAPKELAWYCGFALLVTLAWVYFEAVRLAFRVAILFGGRE